MEAISPYKSYLGNSKKTNHHFISGLIPFQSSNFPRKGRSQASSPFLSHSYPPFYLQQPPQPPLLPLPAANHHRRAATRGISSPPNNRKIYKTRDSSKSSNYPRKANNISSPKKHSDCASVSPTPPQNGIKVSPFLISSDKNNSIRSQKQTVDQCDKFSGSVTFAFSPPPSSLPLPTFSLRPKLSCMVEAAGIDSGATDNLRRLLRIL